MMRTGYIFVFAACGILACGSESASLPSTTTTTTTGAGGQSTASNGTGGSTGSQGAAEPSGTTTSTTSGAGGGGGSAPEPCTPSTGTEPVGSDSVRDKATCLVWQKTEGGPLNNINAAKFCADLQQDGFDDWRLPRPEEMATWPELTSSANAYVTSPTYIAKTAADDETGCIGNAHSCNIAKYSMSGAATCAWQGVGFSGPLTCVRGVAADDSLPTEFTATQCSICASHVSGASADFKEADCLPYAD